jgi:hypothetical protein
LPYCDWVQNSAVIQHYSYPSEKENSWTLDQVYLFAKNAMDVNQEHTPSYTADTYIPTPQDLYGIFDYENASGSMKLLENDGDTWQVLDADGFLWKYNFWTRWIIKRPFEDYSGMMKMLHKKIDELESYRLSVDWESYGREYKKHMLFEIEKSSTPVFFFTPFGGLGFDILYLLVGWEYLAEIIYSDDKKFIRQYVNGCVELALKWIEAVADVRLSPMALIYSDIAYKTGMMISPVMLEEFLGEGICRLTEAYHKKKIKVIYHSEGYLKDFLPVLMKNNVDGINPLEPYSNMEIFDIRREFPELVLVGGINDGHGMLLNADKEEVVSYVRRVIKELGPDSGILLGSTGEVGPACDPQNVIAMIDTIRSTYI